MANQGSFMKQMNQYAMSAGASLGMPSQVILAQWALESTYGTSDLAVRANNFAGIKYTENGYADYKSGSYAGYNSVSRFVDDYIRVMQLPYYNGVRNAGGVRETIVELGKSPYAEDTSYATKLLAIVGNNDVTPGIAGNVSGVMGVAANVFMSPFVWVGLFFFMLFKR